MFGLLLAFGFRAEALISCSPPSCSPGCDSSCEYKTCDAPKSVSFTISILPHSYVTPADACEDGLDGQVFRVIPIAADDLNVNALKPDQISHRYKGCQSHTSSGPACPPPAEPEPYYGPPRARGAPNP